MADQDKLTREVTERLVRAAGDSLSSVILYGARAHGDYESDADHIHLLVVLRELDLEHLERVAEPIRWWLNKKKPFPRILSPRAIREGADVFPIEILDIMEHRQVLFGEDPFAALEVSRDHLRAQCERELRETLMRVQEGYIEADGKERRVRHLLVESYLTFAAIFRGCLRLTAGAGDRVPARTVDAVRRFCDIAGLDAAPFAAIDARCAGTGELEAPLATFARYHAELLRAIDALDRFVPEPKGEQK